MSASASAGHRLAVVRSALHPPLGDRRFWVVQAMVVAIAGAHLLFDIDISLEAKAFPTGLPVGLLIIPVAYAASRYGLAGSAATGLWATLLWLPDLLLPNDQGHIGSDLVELALVDFVAFFVGQRTESERLARRRSEQATADHLAAEALYHRMFESSRSPMLVLDTEGRVVEPNPAAVSLLGGDLVGRRTEDVVGPYRAGGATGHSVLTLPDGRDYRMEAMELPPGAGGGGAAGQVVLEDVTAERSEIRRARWYAGSVVRAEEDQRRRLARELHDEPLQIFLHVARQMERLGSGPAVPPALVEGLAQARQHALGAASSLRRLARGLRPPTLDQLGLVAAISSLVSDIEESQPGLDIRLDVDAGAPRFAPDVELGLFRIAQEATTNTLRHANASRLVVSLHVGPDALVLSVTDNGRGFDASPIEHEAAVLSHLGLLGMTERARLLGGSLVVTTVVGQGTVVEATVPPVPVNPPDGAGSAGPGPAVTGAVTGAVMRTVTGAAPGLRGALEAIGQLP